MGFLKNFFAGMTGKSAAMSNTFPVSVVNSFTENVKNAVKLKSTSTVNTKEMVIDNPMRRKTYD